jgi:rhodanese-related sulfurtransferase
MLKIFNLSVIPTVRALFTALLFLFAVASNAEELKNISPEQLLTLQNNGALVIDIRTAKEWATSGTIPSSEKLEFFNEQGEFDAKKWLGDLNQLHPTSRQPIILVCRSGNRSSMLGNYLTKKLGMENIYHLQNGITSWIKAGNKINKN